MITKIDSQKLELVIQLYLNYKGVLVSFLGLLENGLENLGFVSRAHMVDQKIKCFEHSKSVSLQPEGQTPAVLHMA